jgi:hypothetical protein
MITAAPGEGLFETGHLWFLVCLLAFSLVLLPGLSLLLAGPGARLVEGLARLLVHPAPSPVTRPRDATGAPHVWGNLKAPLFHYDGTFVPVSRKGETRQ